MLTALLNLSAVCTLNLLLFLCHFTHSFYLSLEHGIEAALKTAIDCKFITRDKPGLFSKGTNIVTTSFAKEAWIATFFELNGKKSLSINDLYYEPVMSYLSDLKIDWKNTKILETVQDYSNQVVICKLK